MSNLEILFTKLILVCLLITTLGCSGNSDDHALHKFSSEEMKEFINNELVLDSSTKNDVVKFLKENNIGYTEQPDLGWTPNGLNNVDWIAAAIPQKRLFYHNYNLIIDFYFDRKDHKLIKYEVTSTYSSL